MRKRFHRVLVSDFDGTMTKFDFFDLARRDLPSAADHDFWQDYVDGKEPYFTVPANSLDDWPFNFPNYSMFPVLNLAVSGSGGGDPRPGNYPADLIVDYVRVW